MTLYLPKLARADLEESPELAWNAFVDLAVYNDYVDLDPVQKVAYLVFWYDAKVQNGGHELWLSSPESRLFCETLDALEAIGAISFRENLTRLMQVSEEQTPTDLGAEPDDTREALLAQCDKTFYSSEPELLDILENFVTTQIEKFISLE